MPVITDKQISNQKIKRSLKISSIIVAAFIMLLLISAYVVEPFEVNGISMEPTLHTGNILLVWKFPQTWAEITNSQYIPSRANIIILEKTQISEEQLVKRVIGLPGDSI